MLRDRCDEPVVPTQYEATHDPKQQCMFFNTYLTSNFSLKILGREGGKGSTVMFLLSNVKERKQ